MFTGKQTVPSAGNLCLYSTQLNFSVKRQIHIFFYQHLKKVHSLKHIYIYIYNLYGLYTNNNNYNNIDNNYK